jgi:hypothetical protein
MDASDFPRIRLQVLARDGSGDVLPELPKEALTIQENEEEQSILSTQAVDAGLRLVVVIEPGDGSLDTGVTLTDLHATALEHLRTFTVGRPWMLADADEVTLLIQEGATTNLLVESTSNPETLLNRIESYIPPVGVANRPGQKGDYTRAALVQALKELRLARPGFTDRAEAILLYTPGMRADLVDVAEEAISLGIPIHIILARPNLLDYWSEPLAPLADVTGGEYLATQVQSDPEPIFEKLASQRTQHIVVYETSLGTSGEREVTLRATGGAVAKTQYSIDLQAPRVEITAPESKTITREAASELDSSVDAEPAFITVEAEVEWPDDMPRPVSQARLLVEGIVVGQGQVIENQVEIPWDLRAYDNEVTTLVTIEVELVDAFGFQVRSAPRAISLRYIPFSADEEKPPDPVPGPDSNYLIFALVGFAVLSLGLALFVIFNRPRFAPALQEAREGIADFVERVTGKRTALVARAYLVPLEGFDKLPRKSFEIYGTTAIGRSRRHADLLFHISEEDSPISRLHCTILDEDDHFSIRDEDSSNGTYINGEKLMPLTPSRLRDGDRIEIAPLERGGLQLRFHLAEEDTPPPQPEGEVRMTRPARQIRPSSDRDTMSEL